MSTDHHTPLGFRGPLTAVAMEAPLSQLDAAIGEIITSGSGASTSLTAQASAGQATLAVANSAGFAPGDPIYIGTGAIFESRIINTVPDGTTITVTVNLSNTYAAGKPVSKSPVEIVDARAGFTTLGGRLSLFDRWAFDVRKYGAKGDGSTDDTTAIQAACTAADAAGGGVVYFPPGAYKTTATINVGIRVSLVGAVAGDPAPDVSVIVSSTGANPAVSYLGANNPPGTGWASLFTVRNLTILHTGSAAALRIERAFAFTIENVVARSAAGTGNGIELVNCYVVDVVNVRSLYFAGSAFRIENTGFTQPGTITLRQVHVRADIGFDIVSSSGVMDSVVLSGCIATDCTTRGLSITGAGGNRNLFVENIHIEHSSNSNACTGIYQSGADCSNLRINGVFAWGLKKPIDITGTVVGFELDGVYLNPNAHGSPLAAITTSANVSKFRLGHVLNAGATYPTLLADSSQAATRRKTFAGAAPAVAQCSGSLTLGTSLADLTGATYSATTELPEIWLVVATFDINITVSTAGLCTGVIDFDGGTVGGSAFFDPANGTGRATVTTVHVITGVAAGAHTVKLRGQKANGTGTAAMQAASSRIAVYRFAG